jgi:hypothetical protein
MIVGLQDITCLYPSPSSPGTIYSLDVHTTCKHHRFQVKTTRHVSLKASDKYVV